MDWLIPVLTATFIGSTILCVVFSYLYYSEKAIYLKLWSVSWALNSLRYVFLILYIEVWNWPWFFIANQTFALWSIIFIFLGARNFANQSFDYKWIFGAAAALNVWIMVSILNTLPFVAITIPIFTVMGGMFVWVGLIFLCRIHIAALERHIAGWTFILWGIHKLIYPFAAPLEWLATWGYLVSAALSLIAALSIILLYFRITRKKNKESHARFLRITENANDIIFRMSLPDGRYEYMSPACLPVTGYTPQEFYNSPFLIKDIIHPDFTNFLQDRLSQLLDGKVEHESEYKIIHKSGHERWMNQRSILIKDSEGNPVAIEGIVRDITKMKRMEESLRQLSLHDRLTGLYNRAFFEEEMKRFKAERHLPIGIIICDVDGLKIINDSLGHATGDIILKSSADILRDCFRQSDIVARIGGDEFAVLIPNCTEDMIQECLDRIFQKTTAHNEENPNLSLSISTGYTIQESTPFEPNELFKQADDNMYKEKLQKTYSSRSATVQALIKTMEARDFVTEGHANRLQEHARRLGKLMGIPNNRLNNLYLLARFHDLGKVAIPDRILFKSDPLTPDEFEQIKTHCEIGRRIAQSTSDLAPIADLILKHHEWWNGRGYPFGIQGEAIPLECRILAIVDAYDAMTSQRPYRQNMSHQKALEELRKCAGTQFDPVLVEKFIWVLGGSSVVESNANTE